MTGYYEGAFSPTNKRTLHLRSLPPVCFFFLIIDKIYIDTPLNIIVIFDCKSSQSFGNLRYG